MRPIRMVAAICLAATTLTPARFLAPLPAAAETVRPPGGAGNNLPRDGAPPSSRPPMRISCGPRDRLVAWLAQRFGEVPRLAAIDRRGFVVEFLAGNRGSWTLLIVRPGGRACIAAAGPRWRPDPGT